MLRPIWQVIVNFEKFWRSYVTFIKNTEELLFVKIFNAVKCMTGVLVVSIGIYYVLGMIDFLNCDKLTCKIKLYAMIKLYIIMRLYHALKTASRRNKSNKPVVKRNRKLMILQHVTFFLWFLPMLLWRNFCNRLLTQRFSSWTSERIVMPFETYVFE